MSSTYETDLTTFIDHVAVERTPVMPTHDRPASSIDPVTPSPLVVRAFAELTAYCYMDNHATRDHCPSCGAVFTPGRHGRVDEFTLFMHAHSCLLLLADSNPALPTPLPLAPPDPVALAVDALLHALTIHTPIRGVAAEVVIARFVTLIRALMQSAQ